MKRKEKKPEEGRKPRKLKVVLISVCAVFCAAVMFLLGFLTYYLTLPSGARSLLWIKSVIDSEYYYDVDEDTFWASAKAGAEEAGSSGTDAYWSGAIAGAVSVLDDYSDYYTETEYQAVTDSYAGNMSGIGMSFFSGTNKLSRVALGSPLFYASADADEPVEGGMYLTGVSGDGTEYTAVGTYAEASAAVSSYGTGDAVWLRFSGENDPEAGSSVTVSLTVSEYTETYLLYACAGTAYAYCYDESGSAVWTDVSAYVTADEKTADADGVAYIRVVRFAGDAGDAFGEAAAQFAADGADRLLLDLRNNGGGQLSVMQKIAAYLLRDSGESSSVIQAAIRKSGSTTVYRAKGNYFGTYFGDAGVYCAANINSASASEALMGAMLCYGTMGYGDIYLTDNSGGGTARTYGKGIMQTTYTNAMTGEAIKLTTAQIYWPNGRCIHGTGITTSDEDESGSPVASYAATNMEYGDTELAALLGAVSVR